MSKDINGRFEEYLQGITAALGHADRKSPAGWYLKGLLSNLPRKSVEPMAALVRPKDVRSAHQSMHHMVAMANWEDSLVIATVANKVAPMIVTGAEDCYLVMDDTGHPKKGKRSVGVARQYCERSGKQDNCQVAVSLVLASERAGIPLSYRLYLPHEWADDRARCRTVGVPDNVDFQTKGQIARAQIAAVPQTVPRAMVLADTAYGMDTEFRDWLCEQGRDYTLAVRSNTMVWWNADPPAMPTWQTPGPARARSLRDGTDQLLPVSELAGRLPPQSWHDITWREGTDGTPSSRFARVRVLAARVRQPRTEEWLLIEWPKAAAEPAHFWLANLPQNTLFDELVRHAKARRRIQRDYQALKSEVGLSHYEGRNWRGFHHHATLCIAAAGFLVLERLSFKQNIRQLQESPFTGSFRPRSSRQETTSRT